MITIWTSKFVKENKLEKITFQGLRHTHASLLAGNNIDIPTLSVRLGHSNSNITNQFYVHSLKSHDVIASQKIEKILL